MFWNVSESVNVAQRNDEKKTQNMTVIKKKIKTCLDVQNGNG